MTMITVSKCKKCERLHEKTAVRCPTMNLNGFTCGAAYHEAIDVSACGDCWMEVHPKAKICPHCRSSLQGVANAS